MEKESKTSEGAYLAWELEIWQRKNAEMFDRVLEYQDQSIERPDASTTVDQLEIAAAKAKKYAIQLARAQSEAMGMRIFRRIA